MKTSLFALFTTLATFTVGNAAGTILVDFAGGNTTGSALANTNALTGSSLNITAGSVVDLTGAAVAGLGISASGSLGIHVNGAAAVLTPSTVTSNSVIGTAFSGYEHAFSSSWGPENAGIANTYSINLSGLMAGTTYTVSVLGGRDGGIGLPANGDLSSTWTLGTGAASLNATASQFHLWDDSGNASSVIQESGSGPFTMKYNLAIHDAGMTVWEFTVNQDNTDVTIGFVNPINAMTIAAIPETSSALLGGLGLLALLRRRRG